MRVLVAGATGALGLPLLRGLVAAGHAVSGLTRSPGKMAMVAAEGAVPVLADALDATWLEDVVQAAAPEAVVHALTALPPAGPRRYRDLDATNRLRTEGTANLLAAARKAGVRRFVAESMILGYGHVREGRADETHPLVSDAGHPRLSAALAALRSLEEQVLTAGSSNPVVLRYGLLYGPGTTTDHLRTALQRRMLALPASAGVISWVHVEDAASATVAALERSPAAAVLNVVDDHPASFEDVARELAAMEGLQPPRRVPRWVVRLASPYALRALDARIPASNAKLKSTLGWVPAYPTYREGLRAAGEGADQPRT